MEYTEVFYAQQPGIAELGIPENLVSPPQLPPTPLRQAKPSVFPAPATSPPTTAINAAPPAKTSYPVTRLPSEEELAASVAGPGSAYAGL